MSDDNDTDSLPETLHREEKTNLFKDKLYDDKLIIRSSLFLSSLKNHPFVVVERNVMTMRTFCVYSHFQYDRLK